MLDDRRCLKNEETSVMLVSFFCSAKKNATPEVRKLLQAEGDHRGLRADVYAAVDNHRRDEFVAAELAVAALRRVIEFIRKVRRVVRVKHAGATIFDHPNDAV